MPFYKQRSATAILAALLWLMTASAPALAACSSPAGVAGEIIYNTAQKVVQYCDNTNWIAAGFPGSGSGGCTNPTRDEGEVIYNTDFAVMQFCGGNVWVPMSYPGSSGDLSNGLVGWWKLDETSGTTAADSSGSGNTGTLTNFPASPWTTGQVNGALTFDGTNDAVTVADSSTMDFDSGQSITLAAWVYFSSLASDRVLIHKHNGFSENYNFFVQSDGSFSFSYTSTTASHRYGSGLGVVTAGQWVHLAAVYTGGSASSAKLYVNGVETSGTWWAGTGADQPVSNNSIVTLGSYNNGSAPSGTYMNGKLDDVRIYKRNLSAAEIALLAAQGHKLVGWWKLDETSGTTAADSSGNGNTGTLANMAGTEWTTGRVNGALAFDGVNDSVNLGSPAALDDVETQGGGGMSISTWFKFNIGVSDGTYALVTKDQPAGTGAWDITFSSVSGGNTEYIAFIKDYATADLSKTWNDCYVAIDQTQWNHFVVTWTGGSTVSDVQAYMNGTKCTDYTFNVPSGAKVSDASSTLNIADGGYATFPGQMDDVRIYNYVLSASEIAQLAGVGADTTSNLVAHWKLDETSGTSAADSAGSNTGTLSNFPASPWTTGQVEGALTFDGVNDYVDAGNPAALQITGSLTLAAWIKMDTIAAGVADDLILGKDALISQSYHLKGSEDCGTQRLQLDISPTADGTGKANRCSTTVLATNTWYHVAGVFNATAQTMDVYVNGVLDNGTLTGTVPSSMFNSTSNVLLGHRSGTSNFFDGVIDDVRVYSRALSPVDIAALADSFPGDCTGPKGYKGEMIFNTDKTYLQYCAGNDWIPVGKAAGSISDGLVAYWKLDETTGTTAKDTVGTNNGTLTNGPTWQPTAGKQSGAISLDGTNDYVDAGNAAVLQITGSLTLAAWIKMDTIYAGSADDYIIAKDSNAISQGYQLKGSEDCGTERLQLDINPTADGTGRAARCSATVLATGTWYHVAGVYNATAQTMDVYVNGVLDNGTLTGTVPSSIFNSTANAWIGHRAGATGYFDGLIDDARIYNRALSPAEIKSLYNATNGTPGPTVKKVFVATNSGAKYNGNLGGIAGADTKCNTEAAAAGLAGTYKAWISLTANATTDPDSTFTGIGGSYNYLLPSGTKVADDWADLIDGSLDAAIDQNASGTSVASGNVWTNVTITGNRDGSTSNTHGCVTWGSALNTRSANVGTAGNTNNTWTDTGGTATCDTVAYLYCFEQ